MKKIKSIHDLMPDDHNANRGTERGLGLLDHSLRKYGAGRSILVDRNGQVIAGNKTLERAADLGLPITVVESDGSKLVVVQRRDLDMSKHIAARELAVADNRVAEVDLEWDEAELQAIMDAGADLVYLFTPEELADIAGAKPELAEDVEEKEVVAAAETNIKPGDMFELGKHRLFCGDTTDANTLDALCGSERLVMIHADPPYGMGKEAEGVANDNLYNEKLDAFQMQWWSAWVRYLNENGSAYIWGCPDDLWRLWYTGGLRSKDLTIRNEIVWDKGSTPGMRSDEMHCYPVATERALFLMRGQQFIGNVNKDDYWEGNEPLRSYMVGERDKMGWTNGDVNRMTKTQMAGHWFTKSQFAPIGEDHYKTLQEQAKGAAFTRSYRQLLGGKAGNNAHFRSLAAKVRERRSYFNNASDTMTDVWQFERVRGEERFGHATPKPLALAMRAIMASSREGDVVGVPFGGTCPEIVACEKAGRAARVVEIEPLYCQTIVDRWEALTGERATKVGETREKRKKGSKR